MVFKIFDYSAPHKWRAEIIGIVFLTSLLVMGGRMQSNAATVIQSGRIKGKVVAVTADKRAPLSGVLVSLSGGILQSRTLQTTSDEEGNYVFNGLVAGDYLVSVELQGFEKYERKVMVPIEASVDLNILLTPLAPRETVNITAEERETRQTESSLPAQINTQTLRNAPLAREKFQDALPLLPGVVRGPDCMLNVKGALASQSGVLVSSLNATDPVMVNSVIDLL